MYIGSAFSICVMPKIKWIAVQYLLRRNCGAIQEIFRVTVAHGELSAGQRERI